MKRREFIACITLAPAAVALAGAAPADTILTGADVHCGNTIYLQGLIDSIPPGGTIHLGPGIYRVGTISINGQNITTWKRRSAY